MDVQKELLKLRDGEAELAVVCGIIRAPDETFAGLASIGLTEADFADTRCAAAFSTARRMWLAGTMLNVVTLSYAMSPVKADFGGFLRLCEWLGGAYLADWWPEDVATWWQADCKDIRASIALAAAARVKWLSSRRALIYDAREVIRDAANPTAGPGEIDRDFGKLRPQGGGDLF